MSRPEIVVEREDWRYTPSRKGMVLRTTRIKIASLLTLVLAIWLVASFGRAAAQDPAGSQNRPPGITGLPVPSILQGELFGFVPTASDADGDTLTFWIANKPGWAQFQPTTGVLYGVPGSEDVGAYERIQIWVTDGQAWTALPAFDIDVLASDLPWLRLSWDPPTTNIDGSMLSNLAGYRIYVFPFASTGTQIVEVSDPRLTSYLLGNLSPDIFAVAITSINSAGRESDYSELVIQDLR